MTPRPPMNIAHRGASAYAPENTMAAFRLGLEMGADGLETDLRFTRDGQVVLMHDATVDRTTDGHGPVAELTLDEVRCLDAGVRAGARWAGERVPTLGEFLDAFAYRTHLALELKADGLEGVVAAELRSRGLADTVTVTAFERERVEQLLRALPGVRTGYLAESFGRADLETLVAAGIRQACPRATVVDAAMVGEAHRLGLEVRAWGVRDEGAMRRVLDAGVDGMTVNWPDRLAAELRRRAGAEG